MDKIKAAYDKECGIEEKPEEEVDEETHLAAVELDAENAMLSAAETFVKANPAHENRMAVEAGINSAHRRVKGQVTLLVDMPNGLGSEIAKTVAGQARGSIEEKTYALLVVDAKLLCECGSQARYRVPPTRIPQLSRLVTAALESREQETELVDGDIMIGIDGGKGREFEDKLMKAIKQKHLVNTKVHVFYTQDSIEKRMERASKAPLDLAERVNLVATDTVTCKAGGS